MGKLTSLSGALKNCGDDDPSWGAVYDRFVDGLHRKGVGGSAPGVGDALPAFALPNSRGAYVQSEVLVAKGPLVLSFNRGDWCPYCRAELSAWADAMSELKRAGGTFVAVTPEIGGRAAAICDTLGSDAEVLCDVDQGLALQMGLAYRLGSELRESYLACGLDLAEAYGTQSWFIPVPATFVIGRDGIVRFSLTDPDFRIRAEPTEVIAVVAALTGLE